MSSSIALRLFQDDSPGFYSPCKQMTSDDTDMSLSPMTEYLRSNQMCKTPLTDEDSRDSGIGLDDASTAAGFASFDTSRPFSDLSKVILKTKQKNLKYLAVVVIH